MMNTVKKLKKNRRLRSFILNMKRPRTNEDLIHFTALPEMPNQDERRSIRIEWSILSKGAERPRI
jgi:hypothetical protein